MHIPNKPITEGADTSTSFNSPLQITPVAPLFTLSTKKLSPLVALINDQVANLNQMGFDRAGYISSLAAKQFVIIAYF